MRNGTYPLIFQGMIYNTSPAVSHWSCSFYLDALWDGKWVAVQLLFCVMLLPGFVSVHVVHQYCSSNKKSHSILIATHVFPWSMLTSLSVDKILLPNANRFTNFRGLPLNMEMAPFCWKYINSVLLMFTLRLMPSVFCSYLRSWDSSWIGVFTKNDGSLA